MIRKPSCDRSQDTAADGVGLHFLPIVAASLANMPRGATEGNQRASKSENQDANLHVDRQQAAEMLNVSPRSVATAAMVERETPEEVAQAVKSGAMIRSLLCQDQIAFLCHLPVVLR